MWRSALVGITAALLVMSPGPFPRGALAQSAAEQHVATGVGHLLRGRVEQAIVEFQAALRLRADFPEAHAGLGEAYEQQGRVDDALRHFDEAERLAPSNTHYRARAESLRARIPRQAVAPQAGSQEVVPPREELPAPPEKRPAPVPDQRAARITVAPQPPPQAIPEPEAPVPEEPRRLEPAPAPAPPLEPPWTLDLPAVLSVAAGSLVVAGLSGLVWTIWKRRRSGVGAAGPSIRQGAAAPGPAFEISDEGTDALMTLVQTYEGGTAVRTPGELAKARGAAESILRRVLADFRHDPRRAEGLITRWAPEFHLPRLIADLSRAYADLAFEESHAERRTHAQRYLERALALDPENVRAKVNLHLARAASLGESTDLPTLDVALSEARSALAIASSRNVRALFAQLCQKRASVVLKQLGSDALAGRCEADSMRAAVSGSIEWIEAALNALATDEEDLVAPLRDARARLLSVLNGG